MDVEGSFPDYKEPWQDSDVVLVVEEEEFHVHKPILSLYSAFFRTLFTSDFLEKQQNRIPLPGKKKTSMLEFLNVLYHRNVKVGESNCEILLALADEFQAGVVTGLCREYLSNSLSDNNCLKYYRLGCKYGLADVREKALLIAKDMDFMIYREIYDDSNEIIMSNELMSRRFCRKSMVFRKTTRKLCVDNDYELLEDKDKLRLVESRVVTLAQWIHEIRCTAQHSQNSFDSGLRNSSVNGIEDKKKLVLKKCTNMEARKE